jgi:hypothetical protein
MNVWLIETLIHSVYDEKTGKLTTASQKQFELEDQQRRLLSQLSKMMYYLTGGPDRTTPLPAKWTLSQMLNYKRQRFS